MLENGPRIRERRKAASDPRKLGDRAAEYVFAFSKDLPSVYNESAFTLTEVLIGLLILAIGILAVAGMQFLSIKGNSFSNHLSQASIIAQEGLEHLKALDVTDERLHTGEHDGIRRGIFQGKYKAERTDDYVLLRYSVIWAEGSRLHQISFTTVKGR